MRTGVAQLPLHDGKAPRWLFALMVRLAREVLGHLVAAEGPEVVLRRLSDPFWFQAFGCLLGFDWHSSGLTTTVCGAVKEAVRGEARNFGLIVAGGKGNASRQTPQEIAAACETLGQDPTGLVAMSRLVAKVDNAAVQDGYQLYHHVFLFTTAGYWSVIQQGMSDTTRMARRYHWLGERIESPVVEPHAAVCCDATGPTLNLVAAESQPAQAAIVELATDPNREVLRVLDRLPTLTLPSRHTIAAEDLDSRYVRKVLLATYEAAPAHFQALLGVPGVGPKTLRALALAAELIYGTPSSTRDPARFAFAHGGKDRVPYPVDLATYEQTIEVLRQALDHSRVGQSDKLRALQRLAGFASVACPLA
ncbi:DUF763 domain-containing protein [Nitrospira sp. Kam-Ns4a]